MEFKLNILCLLCVVACLTFVEGQYYRRFGGYGRQRMMAPRRRMIRPRGSYYTSGHLGAAPMSLAGAGIGYHDNGLDQLIRRRYRNPMMQRRHNLGVFMMFAAESLGCKTVNDVMGPDFAHYEPSRCSAAMSCLASGSGRPKQVQAGSVCMCCPPTVTTARIRMSANTRGRERYYEKVNTYDPSEMGMGRMGSDYMQDRMEMQMKMMRGLGSMM